jgi:hypothetical protein
MRPSRMVSQPDHATKTTSSCSQRAFNVVHTAWLSPLSDILKLKWQTVRNIYNQCRNDLVEQPKRLHSRTSLSYRFAFRRRWLASHPPLSNERMPARPKESTAQTALARTRERDHVIHGSSQGKDLRGCWCWNLDRFCDVSLIDDSQTISEAVDGAW